MDERIDFGVFSGIDQIGAIFEMFLPDNIDKYTQLKILTSDVSSIARLHRFIALYPDKYINVGIAEQNLIGVSAGLTSEGYKCVAFAQAVFMTMRCFDQIRQYMSYMEYPIVLVGLGAGFMMQFMGNSHYAMEDIAIMKSLPGIVILSPADAGESVKAFELALKINRPVYIRLTGDSTTSSVYKEDFPYELGKANTLKWGDDVTIFATGSMVYRSLQAAEILESKNISVKVLDVHTIKPLDTDAINNAKESKLFVSVEEHHVTGGLGSSIADHCAVISGFPPLLKLGIKDKYSVVGDYQYLLEHNKLTSEHIAQDIINQLRV
jgi:transketolase